MMKRIVTCVCLAMVAVLPVLAAEQEDDTFLKMKAGDCTFKLLDAKGVKPLAGSELSFKSVQDGATAAKVTADKLGKCPVKLDVGKYVLAVDSRPLAIVLFEQDAQVTTCRIVVPEEDVAIGGAEQKKKKRRLVPILIGGGVAGGATLAAINNLDDTPAPAPAPRRSSRQRRDDDDDSK